MAYADEHQLPLRLFLYPEPGMSTERLRAFYQRFGFVDVPPDGFMFRAPLVSGPRKD